MRASVFVTALLAVSCGATTSANLTDASTRSVYRVVMSVPLAGATRDVYHSRGEGFADFPRVAEDVCTGYVAVDAAGYEINVRDPAGVDPQVPSFDTNFAQGGRYLFVMRADSDGVTSLTQHLDPRTDAGAGAALLRFVNATTDGTQFDVTELVGGTSITAVQPDTSSFDGADNDAGWQLSVPADIPVPLMLNPGGRFTTAPLQSNALITVVVRNTSAAPELLLVPPVDPVNSTTTSAVLPGGQLVVVDNATIDGGFGSIIANVRQSETIGLGPAQDPNDPNSPPQPTGTLPALDLTSTYIVIASTSGANVVFTPYRDTSAVGSLRVINAMAGLSAPDITLNGPAITYSDLVFGAAASQALASPTAVTSVTVTDASGTTTYAPQLTADTRYMILVGDAAGTKGITTLSFANDAWTSAFVSAQ